MDNEIIVDVVIPALNEERSIGSVIGDIPADLVRKVVVADNGSTDATAAVATAAGAVVVEAPRRGYGSACLAGLAELELDPPDICVFLDGDYSDHPEELAAVIAPILEAGADMVIGSRTRGEHEPGALLPQAVFGNWLACTLIRALYGAEFTDLGPFRAITWEALERIGMQDPDFGWTVEMQVKAARLNLQCAEVPVSYRKRVGKSKVTGTLKGTVMAGYKILWTIYRYSDLYPE